MKKLLTLLLLPLLFGGCELGDDDESHTEIWTVASEKGVAGIAMDFGHTPAYIVKKGSAAAWEIFSGSVVGFTFEKGYESPIRVGSRSRGRSKASVSSPASKPASGYGPSPNTTIQRATTR